MDGPAAWVPGVAQVLMQAIWECRDAPPLHGPAGRAVRTARALGWVPMGVWWRWHVPGHGELLDLVAEDWALLRHRIRESLRRVALLRLEARRPQTFGGLAGTIDRRACRLGLARFHGETELSILQGLLTGATWTASQAAHEAYPDLPVLRGSSDQGRATHPLALRMLVRRKGHMAPVAAGGHGQPTCSEHGSR